MSSIDGLRSRGEKKQTYSGRVEMRKAASVRNINVKVAASKPTTTQKKPARTIPINSTQPNRRQPQSRPKSIDMVANPKQHRESFIEPVKNFDFNFDSNDISKNDMKEAKKQQKTKDKKNKQPKDKKKHKKLKIVLISIAAVFAILITVALIWGNDIIAKITGGNSGIFDLANLISENYVDLKTDSKGRTNILVFGTSGYNMAGDEGGGTHDGAQLTDSIMAVSLDQITGDVAMVSLPRDLKVSMACSAGKINEVYWCANQGDSNEAAGAKALQTQVQAITGLEFQYYAHVNWESLIELVDAVGGITVTLDESIEYDYIDYNNSNVVATIQENVPTELTGRAALGVSRARHQTKMGDFSRGNNQQKIIIALAEKVLNTDLDIAKALSIVSAIGDNIRTDFTTDDIKTLAHLAMNLDLNNIRQVPLIDYNTNIYYVTTSYINGISYVIPSAGVNNYTEIQKYIAKMFDSNPVVREGSTIEILNGTEEAGVASNEKEKLTAEGFVVAATNDAPTNDYQGYSIYMVNPNQTGTKKKLEDFYHTEVKPINELPAGIVSNSDFIIIVGA